MTNDDLERALLALPLEEPPTDLHGRILAATIYRARLHVRAWEIWVAGSLVAMLVWLTVLVMTGVPDVTARVLRGLEGTIETFAVQATSSAVLWSFLGISAAVWVSQITLPQRHGRTIDP